MQDQISTFLRERVDAGDFPSAVYLVADKGEIVLHGAVGEAVRDPETIEAQPDTIYDLASLTKPLVTGLLTAMLIDSGHISPDQRVATLLNEFDVEGKRTIKISDLLTHTSHLPAWRPFYLLVPRPSKVMKAIAGLELELGGDAVIYSDPNFITLAAIIERFADKRLDELAAERIFRPLGLKDTFFNPPPKLRVRIAASEKGNLFEQQTCIDEHFLRPESSFIDPRFRTDTIWGEVHDNNAYYMNGVAGHAGLFSTAVETFEIAQQFLAGYTSLLKPQTCELFRTNFTKGMNEDRSLGFQLASTEGTSAGTRLSPESFGHNGFTGTSLWIDPATERIYILLTNRTHNRELPFVNINSVRRRFHDLAAAHLNQDS